MARDASFAEDRRKLDRLRALRMQPGAAQEYAVDLLAAGASEEVLLSALSVLREHPVRGAHDALVARYREMDANPKRRDPVGGVRTAILAVLRNEMTHDDRSLALRAVATYEKGLQGPSSTGIRAAGLICLAGLDPDLAPFYAAKMLGEADDLAVDGEPMLTALRVLYSAGQAAAIAVFALTAPVPNVHGQRLSEIRGEAIRLLIDLPDDLAASIAARFMGEDEDDDLVLLGVADLLVKHPGGPNVARELRALLQVEGHHEVFQYLAAAIVASRHDGLLTALVDQARSDRDRTKVEIAAEALRLTTLPEAQRALPELLERAGQRKDQR
ncbi:MAG: hypothetical protein ACKVVT_08845 [Dehalococcoidia bacterium]